MIDDKVAALNRRLKERIIADMRMNGVEIVEDIGKYKVHEELKYYYPDFLFNNLRKEIS